MANEGFSFEIKDISTSQGPTSLEEMLVQIESMILFESRQTI